MAVTAGLARSSPLPLPPPILRKRRIAKLYLLSDLASGVTGEVHQIENGYPVIRMKQKPHRIFALS